MYHASTVCQGHISITDYIKRLFPLSVTNLIGIGKQRLILLVFQIFPLIPLQYGIFALQHRIAQSLCQIVGVTIILHLYIRFVRINTKSHIARQRPGGCSPCQNISIFSLYLKPGNGRTFFHILIPLSHLMAGQRSSAAGTVRNNLKSLIQKSFFPNLL